MRDKIIDYFIGDPEEFTVSQELGFHTVMSIPVLLFIIIMILV